MVAQRKGSLVQVVGILLPTLLAIAYFPHSAYALSNVELSVFSNQLPSASVSACPDSVITSDELNVVVTNNGENTDTFLLSLDWFENSGFIVPEITLASGESRKIEPFWLTVPYDAAPGIYTATVTAKSTVTGDISSSEIQVEVMQCRAVKLSANPSSSDLCLETEKGAEYELNVTNNGKWDETFVISSDADWVSFPEDTVTLSPGETKTVTATANPPRTSPGTLSITFAATPEDQRFSYVKDSSTVSLELKDCYNFNASLEPEESRICSGESAGFTLFLRNTGIFPDIYTLSTPEWVSVSNRSVTLLPSEEREIKLAASPEAAGVSGFDVKITPGHGNEATLSSTVIAEQCKSFEIAQIDIEKTVCSGLFSDQFTVQIKNTGKVENTISLSTTFGELDQDEITLSPGETKEVHVKVVSPAEEGRTRITLTATDGVNTRTEEMTLVSERCYSAEAEVRPESVYACAGENANYSVFVNNTGSIADVFTVDYGIGSESMFLGSGQSGSVPVVIPVVYEEPGIYALQITISSQNGVNISRAASLNVLPKEECYSVLLSDGNGTIRTGEATGKAITVKNTGKLPQSLSVSLSGAPEWVYLEPQTLELETGEEGKVYLYVSPPFGTEPGEYRFSVVAGSKYSEGELPITVTVPGEEGENEAVVTIGEEKNETNVTLNVTTETGNESGEGTPITGIASGEETSPDKGLRITAIAVIVLLIIIILAIRFILLFRK